MTLCLTAVNQSGYRDFYAQSDTFSLMVNSPTVSHDHFYHYIFYQSMEWGYDCQATI